MACTPADIERWLGEFAGSHAVRVAPRAGGTEFIVDAGGWPIRIAVSVLPPRVVALLRMPQLDVAFDFPEERGGVARDWVERFDRHTQRGGG